MFAQRLAGLLACGTCGRRLESAWSNGKPADVTLIYDLATRTLRDGTRNSPAVTVG
jgi:hypothetical protein